MSKFSKIRKWAEEQGYACEDLETYDKKPAIQIKVNDTLSFCFEMRASTIYRSVRGQKGNRAGIYMFYKWKPKDGRYIPENATCQYSQTDAIESMKTSLKLILGSGR